jgi:serine/threonine-protein kinase
VIGDVLSGRYRVTRLLGRGGMSAVWLARDDVLDRDVAVKMLHIRRLESAEAVERFEREARTLASLAHPGIVMVIDRGDDHGRPFIVFEYVRGRDLRERIAEEGRLPLADALAITGQVADALEYAHQRGVIHRDVKPANVLLTTEGQAKLTDFGIARVLEAPDLTLAGRVLGTGDYLAPEQAAGEVIDARADVYALGVLLYHALTGEVPFHADSYIETARLHANAPIPNVREARPDLPAQIDAILQRALAKRPEDRYADCGELRDELQALAAAHTSDEEDTDEFARVPREPTVLVSDFQLPPLDDEEPFPPEAPLPLPLPVTPIPIPIAQPSAFAPPARRGRGVWRILSVVLLLVVLGAGVAVAAYIVQANDSSDAATTTAATTGPVTQPVGTSTTSTTTTPAVAVLRPITIAVASSYDPEGDGSERQDLAPLAIDADATTAWTTENYKSSVNDLAGKSGVGLVLDAGQAVAARRIAITTLAPGWQARIFSTKAASIPAQLTGWTAISSQFTMSETSHKVTLTGPPARFFLIWITKLTGQPGDWNASIASASLFVPKG